MRTNLVRATFVVLALLASFALAVATPATSAPADASPEIQAGVIDYNATDQVDEWEISPQADIFMSENGYVVVALRNLGSAVGFAVLLDGDVVKDRYLQRDETDVIYLDDVPLGGVITVVGADVELAQYTVPDEHS